MAFEDASTMFNVNDETWSLASNRLIRLDHGCKWDLIAMEEVGNFSK